MSNFQERVAKFESELRREKTDLKELRRLCFQGIPDHKNFRPLCWRILLNYLPLQLAEWPLALKKSRDLYYSFVTEMIKGEPADSAEDDHPLSVKDDSQWKNYFKDNEFLLQIDRDVRRTLPDMAFFQKTVDTENPYYSPTQNLGKVLTGRIHKKTAEQLALNPNAQPPMDKEYHWNVIERLLFIYTKLNPGVGYVQGMNDIIGPLYFVFANDPSPEWRAYAEADCFFCFVALMSEIRDSFVKTLDNEKSGIKGAMKELNMLLKKIDYVLWKNLADKQLEPEFYSFRWITLLLSQEFKLPEVIQLWDFFFADPNRFEFLNYFCCAMLVYVKDELLGGDFGANLSLLQNYPVPDIDQVIKKAFELREIPLPDDVEYVEEDEGEHDY